MFLNINLLFNLKFNITAYFFLNFFVLNIFLKHLFLFPFKHTFFASVHVHFAAYDCYGAAV